MKLIDLLEEIWLALMANKVRSGLTILGIVIGIGSVIALIAIGQGSQSTIQSSIESLGSNLIMVTPGQQRTSGFQASQGRGSAQTLMLSDAEAIATNISLAKAVAPEVSGRYQVTVKGANTNTSVTGVTSQYPTVRNVEVDQGTFITDLQNKELARVAVIGPTVGTDLFGTGGSPIGQTIRIKLVDFKVIGITKSKGGTGFGNQDDLIFVPLSTAQQFFSGSSNVSTISIQAADQQSMAELQSDVNSLLLTRHKITDQTKADFSILNQTDILSTASSITNTFTLLLGSIAAISLLVGGIGIMNMMLTNVTERTKEIGLRKAIGAYKRDINYQFLLEAIALTFIGGGVGILLGWLVAALVHQFTGLATTISISSVLLAFGVSAGIGIIFGYYPARRAASLNPIEALRYE